MKNIIYKFQFALETNENINILVKEMWCYVLSLVKKKMIGEFDVHMDGHWAGFYVRSDVRAACVNEKFEQRNFFFYLYASRSYVATYFVYVRKASPCTFIRA